MPQLYSSQHVTQRCLETFGRDGGLIHIPRDNFCYAPNADFMRNEFTDALKQVVGGYVAEASDCEDKVAKAQSLMSDVMVQYAKDNPGQKLGGNTLGSIEAFLKVPWNGIVDTWHAFCFFLDEEDRLWLYEPQRDNVSERIIDAEAYMERGGFDLRHCKP